MTDSAIHHSHERNKDTRGSYALVNDLNMYYEIHGTGKPQVLLHGGLAIIEMLFGQLLPIITSFLDTSVLEVEQDV